MQELQRKRKPLSFLITHFQKSEIANDKNSSCSNEKASAQDTPASVCRQRNLQVC